MPGPVIKSNTLFDWDPAAIASKLPESLRWAGGAALQGLKTFSGADDPSGQSITGVGVPMMAADTEITPAAYNAIQGLKGFYSRVTDAVTKHMPDMAHPNKVMSLIKNLASPEEAQMRGLTGLLEAHGNQPISKAVVLDHLDRNPINLGEQTYPQAMESGRTNSTTYSEYQVPGATNYKETLITKPVEHEGVSRADYEDWLYKRYGGYDRSHLLNDPDTYRLYLSDRVKGDVYQSSHWPHDNPLVHIRTGQHTLPSTEPVPKDLLSDVTPEQYQRSQGKTGTMVENVQSDWHQAGASGGYKVDKLPPGYDTHEFDVGGPKRPAVRSYYVSTPESSDFEVGMPTGATPEEAQQAALTHLNSNRVPDAPFKSQWPALGLKKAILDAAHDPNAHWIGVTPGDQLIKRGEGYSPTNERTVRPPRVHDNLPLADQPRFNDQQLPNELGKLLKPFGGQMEKGDISLPNKTYGLTGLKQTPSGYVGTIMSNDNYGESGVIANSWPPRSNGPDAASVARGDAMDLVQTMNNQPSSKRSLQIPLSQLSPEMKAAIAKKGFPLLSLMGLMNQRSNTAGTGEQ